jgi:hypothetical protein
MKIVYHLFLVLCCISLESIAQKKSFTVETADQFVDAIGSDRIIKLKSDIDLSTVKSDKKGQFFQFKKEYDGYELNISGVKNLKIIGLGDKPIKITTKPQYGDVIAFDNCTNVFIENVDAGHGPQKGYCTGGVFNISNSKSFTINKSILYGSGTEGITARNVIGLKCTNTIIRGCTYSIMTLNTCEKFQFTNCEFSDNQEFDLVNIANSKEIKFVKSTFLNNRTGTESYSDYALFNVSESSVSLTNCVIEKNTAISFEKTKNSIQLIGTSPKDNTFRQSKAGN